MVDPALTIRRIMKSYPIWNNVEACIYKSPKSYGVKKDGKVKVCVGTSASNSHDFVEHVTTYRQLSDGSREYRFYVDGKCIKRAVLHNKADKLEFIAA
jgi:hypothetical protein